MQDSRIQGGVDLTERRIVDRGRRVSFAKAVGQVICLQARKSSPYHYLISVEGVEDEPFVDSLAGLPFDLLEPKGSYIVRQLEVVEKRLGGPRQMRGEICVNGINGIKA